MRLTDNQSHVLYSTLMYCLDISEEHRKEFVWLMSQQNRIPQDRYRVGGKFTPHTWLYNDENRWFLFIPLSEMYKLSEEQKAELSMINQKLKQLRELWIK
jgi:hypothetical protein